MDMLDRTGSDLDEGDKVKVFDLDGVVLEIRLVEGRHGGKEPVAICKTKVGQCFAYTEEIYLMSKGRRQ